MGHGRIYTFPAKSDRAPTLVDADAAWAGLSMGNHSRRELEGAAMLRAMLAHPPREKPIRNATCAASLPSLTRILGATPTLLRSAPGGIE